MDEKHSYKHFAQQKRALDFNLSKNALSLTMIPIETLTNRKQPLANPHISAFFVGRVNLRAVLVMDELPP